MIKVLLRRAWVYLKSPVRYTWDGEEMRYHKINNGGIGKVRV